MVLYIVGDKSMCEQCNSALSHRSRHACRRLRDDSHLVEVVKVVRTSASLNDARGTVTHVWPAPHAARPSGNDGSGSPPNPAVVGGRLRPPPVTIVRRRIERCSIVETAAFTPPSPVYLASRRSRARRESPSLAHVLQWPNLQLLLLAVTLILVGPSKSHHDDRQQCYSSQAVAQRCLPPYINVAYTSEVHATNTCGVVERQEFCVQSNRRQECDWCDSRYDRFSHPARYVTDVTGPDNVTWWQSETLWEGVTDEPVNLTLNFKRPYLVYHIILSFHGSSPDSFIIYKRRDAASDWEPFQYYSNDCEGDFDMEDVAGRRRRTLLENLAVCTSDGLTDALQGGTVAFRPLELRNEQYEIANDSVLLGRERWLTAEQIMISLLKINTFGDEIFKVKRVMQSYFFAISDITIGARCQCHGHAKQCVPDPVNARRETCVCEHNTMGDQCQMCKPLFNNRPWAPATARNANECQRCLCNGRSSRCEFDQELYERTGNGGRCVDCRDNTSGVHCEKCKDNHYLNDQGVCVPCTCNAKGSKTLQCDKTGQCPCKPGVGGRYCDRCLDNHYDFTDDGCTPCECDPAGSRDSPPRCDDSGRCWCKANVEGQRCDLCKPGFFNLDFHNDRGCVACFCHGHSANCTSDTSYFQATIKSEFRRGSEKWSAEDERQEPVQVRYELTDKVISVDSRGPLVFFVAPDTFLGDRRFSYNRFLNFTLRLNDDLARYSADDILIEGADGRVVQIPITAGGQPLPSMMSHDYSFRLHEMFGWQPPLSAVEFIKLLKDVRSIRIRGTYFPHGIGFLEKVSLDTATDTTSELYDPEPAPWVETCTCGESYTGQFCEQCRAGYRRDPNNRGVGAYAKCVACECHGHSDYCDSETGTCICQHNTTGTYCERCDKRFYGNALQGTPDDCQPCPCPDQGECAPLEDGSVTCLACPVGYKGKRCEQCDEGYFGDPQGVHGPTATNCTQCACNDNVDRDSINFCDSRTGECLKCIYNTAGANCERCKPGFFGNATAEKKGDCRRCDCHPDGTSESALSLAGGPLECDPEHGSCDCRLNVAGRQCDRCREGYWNLASRNGCEPCSCDGIGSRGADCDVLTGRCSCRPGVAGDKCDSCQLNHYGFSAEGCRPCECDFEGSVSPQCDADGQCPCRKNFVGRTCDQCKANTYKEQGLCKDCDYCYTLVQDAVDEHREKIEKIRKLLEDVEREPNPEKSPDFDDKLEEVRRNAEELWKDARSAGHSDNDLVKKLRELLARIQDTKSRLSEQNSKVDDAMAKYEDLMRHSKEQAVATAKNHQMLRKVNIYIDNDAREALAEATNRSQRASARSSTMQRISVEVRNLVEKIKEDVSSAMANAQQAKNQSSVAFNLAKETLDDHQRATEAIQDLKRQQAELKGMMARVTSMSKKTQEEAARASDIALNELTEVNNTVLPEQADIEGITSRARGLHSEAVQLSREARQMSESNDPYLAEAYRTIDDARLVVNEARRQQQITDSLLDRVSDSEKRAEEAVKAGNEILESAKETLNTLKNFDSTVAKHREEAEINIQKIPQIESSIGAVARKSQEVKDLIRDAENQARLSKEKADSALRTAQQAKEDINTVANDVRNAQQRASELDGEGERLAGEMKTMAARLEELQQDSDEEHRKVDEVSMSVGNAKSIASETKQLAMTALSDVKSILSQLNSIDSYDEGRLRELERKLAKLESDYAAAQIAARTRKLHEEKERQFRLMKDYGDDMDALRADVQNIQDIRMTLPDDCFRRLTLEP